MDGTTPEVRIETCATHGLKYNAASEAGCVRCRAEGGVAASPEPGPAPPAASAGSPSILVQSGWSAALILGAGFLFFGVHQSMIEQFSGLFGMAVEGGGRDEIELAAAGPYNDSLAEQEVGFFIEMVKDDPSLDSRRAADPELDRLVTQLDDPEFRERLKRDPALRMRHFDEIDRRLYPEIYDEGGEEGWGEEWGD